ncbi:hypothetical protein ACTID9_07075 [Brevibacillus fluminis]|uniref:hypothetical protein n=1 Tax=Brevibacillus fluminis TaxID=511487 RepID=UPI003F8A0188
MNYYSISEVANMLTNSSRSRLVTPDRVWQWIKNEGLRAERAPDNIRVGSRPYLIAETDLIVFLQEKDWDIGSIFPVQ